MNETIKYLFERKQEGSSFYLKYSILSKPFESRCVDFNLLWGDISAFIVYKTPPENLNQENIDYINRNKRDKVWAPDEWLKVYYNRDNTIIRAAYDYGFFTTIFNNFDEFSNFIANKKADEWKGSTKVSVQAVCSSVILADNVKEPVEYSINTEVPQFELIGNKLYKIKREETEYATIDDMVTEACKAVSESMNRKIVSINATHKMEIDNLLQENDNRLHMSFLEGLQFKSYAKDWIISKDFITLKKRINVDKVFYNDKFYDFSKVKSKFYVKDIIVSLHSPTVTRAFTSKGLHPNVSKSKAEIPGFNIEAYYVCIGKELEGKPLSYVIPRLADTLRIGNMTSPLNSSLERRILNEISINNLEGISEWNGWA